MVIYGHKHVMSFPKEIYDKGSYVRKEDFELAKTKSKPKKEDKKMPMKGKMGC